MTGRFFSIFGRGFGAGGREVACCIALAVAACCQPARVSAEPAETTASLLKLPALASVIPGADAAQTTASAGADNGIDLDKTSEVSETSTPIFSEAPVYWGSVGARGGLSIKAVMDMAWRANPSWAKFLANHAEAHAALLEACALPNPEVEGEVGRESSREGEGSRGTWSLGFSQPIELPGKRRARQTEALAGFPVVEREASEFANSLKADVREAYWTVQYHTALEQMHQGQVTITKQQYALAEKRIELGDAGKMELLNARVELLKAQRQFETARRRRQGAMAALDALCGGALGRSFKLSADFPHEYARPSLDSAIRAALSAHPRLGTLAAQLEQKYAGIERQRREWWPDIKVGARHSREFDSDSNALTAAIEIPLWNRNEGGIARAQADAQKIYAEIGVAYNELRRDVEVAYQTLMAARGEIDSYENGLRDAAGDAVRLAWEQLNLGGGGYVEILLAREQLIEIQRGYIQALYEAATAQAAFDRAVGR